MLLLQCHSLFAFVVSRAQGFLTDGEAIDDSSALSAAWLDYLQIFISEKDDSEGSKKSFSQGKALITNKRLIILSCEQSKNAAFATIGTAKLGNDSGKHVITYSTITASQYYPVPLSNFRAVSMDIVSGTESKISVQKNCVDIQPCHKCPLIGPCCTLCCDACLVCGCDANCGNYYEIILDPTMTSNTRWIT